MHDEASIFLEINSGFHARENLSEEAIYISESS